MQNSVDANGFGAHELDLIEAFIRAGATRLFSQFEKSSGYLSLGDSQIAEAAIVIHVASSALKGGHTVWPESPFRDRPDEGTKHLDLLIDLNPDEYETPVLVTVEGKAVSEGFVTKKIREIVRDYGRVCEWNRLNRGDVPIFFVLNDPRRVYGGLVVLCTENLGPDRELARGISEEVTRGLESIKSPIEKLKYVCEVWMVRSFDWMNESPEAREVFESSHEFAGEAVNESLAVFERDLASIMELFPKGTLPKGISHAHAAHLLAGSIMGIKKTCKTSDELRKEIHALITMMIRV